jgi:hypothetical protein
MITPPPVLNSWIKIKRKEKDENGKDVWTGQVQNVSSDGITLCNGVSSVGGGAEEVLVFWGEMIGYDYFKKEELLNYYVGTPTPSIGDLMTQIFSKLK